MVPSNFIAVFTQQNVLMNIQSREFSVCHVCHVFHDMIVIFCFVCHVCYVSHVCKVCHVCNVILCLSYCVCHIMSVISCLSCCVCHVMFGMFVMFRIHLLPFHSCFLWQSNSTFTHFRYNIKLRQVP